MAPRLAGFLHGITDTVYSSIGFIIPVISSAIITKDPYSIEAWKPLWYMCSGICISGLIVFLLFVKCEEQSWSIKTAKVEEDTETLNSTVD